MYRCYFPHPPLEAFTVKSGISCRLDPFIQKQTTFPRFLGAVRVFSVRHPLVMNSKTMFFPLTTSYIFQLFLFPLSHSLSIVQTQQRKKNQLNNQHLDWDNELIKNNGSRILRLGITERRFKVA